MEGIKKVTWKQFFNNFDVSGYAFADCIQAEEIGTSKYVILNAHDMLIADWRIDIISSEEGIIRDRDGTQYKIIDWNEEPLIYIEVEPTDWYSYKVVYPYALLRDDIL